MGVFLHSVRASIIKRVRQLQASTKTHPKRRLQVRQFGNPNEVRQFGNPNFLQKIQFCRTQNVYKKDSSAKLKKAARRKDLQLKMVTRNYIYATQLVYKKRVLQLKTLTTI